jgi:hypothetical protein
MDRGFSSQTEKALEVSMLSLSTYSLCLYNQIMALPFYYMILRVPVRHFKFYVHASWHFQSSGKVERVNNTLKDN